MRHFRSVWVSSSLNIELLHQGPTTNWHGVKSVVQKSTCNWAWSESVCTSQLSLKELMNWMICIGSHKGPDPKWSCDQFRRGPPSYISLTLSDRKISTLIWRMSGSLGTLLAIVWSRRQLPYMVCAAEVLGISTDFDESAIMRKRSCHLLHQNWFSTSPNAWSFSYDWKCPWSSPELPTDTHLKRDKGMRNDCKYGYRESWFRQRVKESGQIWMISMELLTTIWTTHSSLPIWHNKFWTMGSQLQTGETVDTHRHTWTIEEGQRKS